MKVNRLLAGTLALVLIAGLGTPAFAGPPPPNPECGDMYGSVGRGGGTSNPGAVVLVSQTDGSQTFLGDPTANGGVSGIAFDRDFVGVNPGLWGSNVFGAGDDSNLLQINPDDGSLINDVGPIQLNGEDLKITDLGFDPISNQLFGAEILGDLVTIDRTTGAATFIGNLPETQVHIGFAPDGTLYMVDRGLGGELFTIDPTNANVLTQVFRSENIELDALGVRNDGTIFVAGTPFFGDGRDIWTIATDGTMTFIGNGERQVADLDFLPCSVKVGGELLPIETTSLLLAGAQSFSWMIPVILSGIGIGLFVVSRKSENS